MGLFNIPDPVSIVESAKMAGLEREAFNAALSVGYSQYITGMWRSGSSKWALWIGEGQAMKEMAVSAYLSLRQLEKKGFLTLSVPQDLLTSPEISKFQTEEKIS